MTELAQEIRDNFTKIRAKYLGHADAIAPMSVKHIAETQDYITKLEADVKAAKQSRVCSCCGSLFDFQLDTRRMDATPYRIMEEQAVQRMKER